MPVSESVAAAVMFADLQTKDYGGSLTGPAVAALQNVADAMAKCVGHYATNNLVSTDDDGNITGGTPGTPGVFAGVGTGTISGLVTGDAFTGTGLAGEIMAELEAGVYGGIVTPIARLQLASFADAVAVFADYVNDNAEVAVPTVIGVAVSPNLNGPTTGVGTGNAL